MLVVVVKRRLRRSSAHNVSNLPAAVPSEGILLRPQNTDDHLQRLLAFLERRSAYVNVKVLAPRRNKDVGGITDCVRVIQMLCRGANHGAAIGGGGGAAGSEEAVLRLYQAAI